MVMKRATIRAVLWYFFYNIFWPVHALFIGIFWSTLESWNTQMVIYIVLIYWFVLAVLHIVMDMIRTRWWPEIYYQQMRHIQDRYLPRYLEIEGNYVEKIWTGKLIAIMYSWFEKRTSLINDLTWSGVSFLVAFFAWFYFSSKLWWVFVIWYFILFVIISFIAVSIDAPSRQLREKRRDAMNDYSRALVRFIMSRVEIIQNNKIAQEIQNAGVHIDSAVHYTLLQANFLSRMFNIPKAFVNLFRIGMIVLGSYQYFSWKIGIGELSAMLWCMLLIDSVITEFVRAYKNFTKDINIVEKLWDVFDNAPKWRPFSSWVNFFYKKGNISLKNITFSYDTLPVFEQFSLEIAWWTRSAFVGESWGWKSTLIKILAWYISPDQWDVFVDGQNLTEVKLGDYYKHIWYLTQEPSVFDGTIYENLVYALDTPPDLTADGKFWKDGGVFEKVIRWAKCEFIWEFEKWLETEIGERGIRLSGWQKQRLAIAKIMLKNPDIILLDEPTSALDSFNEEQINIALHNLFKGKTVIIVAHRLQTVKQADRIIYIDQGKIVEEGTHDELIRREGKYKKMLDLQSGF